jgi:DNA replication protein DnaC
MTQLDKILSNIKKAGTKRIPQNAKDLSGAKKTFLLIADSMIKAIDEKSSFENNSNIDKEIDFLLKWTSGDDHEGVNKNKGFIFKGETGKGKSFLFNIWIQFLKTVEIKYSKDGENIRINPNLVNVKRISGEYKDPKTGGYNVILKYSKMSCLILDDIGTEDEKSKQYGNGVNIIEEIINLREEKGLLTFGTTNVNEMKKLYDDRTFSRMKRLFDVRVIEHDKDFRL